MGGLNNCDLIHKIGIALVGPAEDLDNDREEEMNFTEGGPSRNAAANLTEMIITYTGLCLAVR